MVCVIVSTCGEGLVGGGGSGVMRLSSCSHGVGKALDGELAQLVPQAGLTSAQTDAVIPFRDRAFPRGSRSMKAEIRRSLPPPASDLPGI